MNILFSISKPFLGIEFIVCFWENQKGKLEILGEDCCSITFEAAALALSVGRVVFACGGTENGLVARAPKPQH